MLLHREHYDTGHAEYVEMFHDDRLMFHNYENMMRDVSRLGGYCDILPAFVAMSIVLFILPIHFRCIFSKRSPKQVGEGKRCFRPSVTAVIVNDEGVKEVNAAVDNYDGVKDVDIYDSVKDVDVYDGVKDIDVHGGVKDVDVHGGVKDVDVYDGVKNVGVYNGVKDVGVYNGVKNVDVCDLAKDVGVYNGGMTDVDVQFDTNLHHYNTS
ncbi:protein TIC 214 [Elysia marginata]|uniref:Protein TIC 214 n=1 Tax=Elysia marginata TaxID=1093978 RepID=A0AAV4FPT8_9GAST|nr:protein TIC 214 [Elysia marginata]